MNVQVWHNQIIVGYADSSWREIAENVRHQLATLAHVVKLLDMYRDGRIVIAVFVCEATY